MGSTRHERSFVDFEKPYEQNIIGLKGIVYFSVGLTLLILITFGLMAVLLNVMRDQERESAGPENPMILTDRERLPPEPRLQAAPGFGLDSPNGRVNMELTIPQAEYRELKKQWDDALLHGEKDAATGTLIALPVDEAKEKLLQQSIKAKTGPEAERVLNDSRLVISDSSAGRMASERIK